MNFLAHLFLASPDPDLMFGGVLADFVRGRAVNDYPDRIQKGIRLHTQIDAFTDNHPIVAAARKRFDMAPLLWGRQDPVRLKPDPTTPDAVRLCYRHR